VPSAAVDRAVMVLERDGWTPAFPPFARERRRGASTPFRNAAGDEIDLHWHVLSVAPAPAVDAELFADADRIEIGRHPALALHPAHELLHAATHGLHWNPINSLRWIADAVTILRATPAFDWDSTIDLAGRLALVQPLRLAVEWLHTRHAAPIPADVVRRLRSRPVTVADRIEWWSRMAGPGLPAGPLRYAVRTWRQYGRARTFAAGEGRPSSFARYLTDALRVDGGSRALAATLAREAMRRLR
jgi:hypothetical protein